MNYLNQETVTDTLRESIENGLEYDQFRELVDRLAQEGRTTGPEQSESLVEYTKLNARRFKRWEKTLKLDSILYELRSLSLPDMDWLIITESWCGDAAHMMPVMQILADNISGTEIKVVLRDENLSLMDQYLTKGARSIPKLIARDKRSGEVLFDYGPRPSEAIRLVEDYKSEYGSLSAEFKEDLQRWYNKDKGKTAATDLVEMLKSL